MREYKISTINPIKRRYKNETVLTIRNPRLSDYIDGPNEKYNKILNSIKNIDVEKINSVLETLNESSQIKEIVLDSNSIKYIPDIHQFKEVEKLSLLVGSITKCKTGEFRSHKRVKELYLAYYKIESLSEFSKSPVEDIRLCGVPIETFDLNSRYLEHVHIQSCPKILKFKPSITAKAIMIEGSKNLDLNSLGGVRKLSNLSLLGTKALKDFSFLDKCKDLVVLTVTATTIRDEFIVQLCNNAKKLKYAWLSASNKKIELLGRNRPDIYFTNGEVTLFKNQKSGYPHLFYEKDKLL